MRIFELFKKCFYNFIVFLGASSHSHYMGVLSRARRALSSSQDFHAQEQKEEAARVWAQQAEFFNCSSGVADGT